MPDRIQPTRLESRWDGTYGGVVALVEEEEIGVLTFEYGDPIKVWGVHVLKGHRRQGVATAMAREAVRVAKTTHGSVRLITVEGKALADTLGLDLDIQELSPK